MLLCLDVVLISRDSLFSALLEARHEKNTDTFDGCFDGSFYDSPSGKAHGFSRGMKASILLTEV